MKEYLEIFEATVKVTRTNEDSVILKFSINGESRFNAEDFLKAIHQLSQLSQLAQHTSRTTN